VLTPAQISAIRAALAANGRDDPESLQAALAIGEQQLQGGPPAAAVVPGATTPTKAGATIAGPPAPDKGPVPPALQVFLLPFLTVQEVRAWIGVSGAFAGDGQVASDWALAHPFQQAPAPKPFGGGAPGGKQAPGADATGTFAQPGEKASPADDGAAQSLAGANGGPNPGGLPNGQQGSP
jgi:hypothetical protein